MDDDARIAELLAHDVEDAAIMFENWPGQTHASVCSLWPAAEMCLAERYADGARPAFSMLQPSLGENLDWNR